MASTKISKTGPIAWEALCLNRVRSTGLAAMRMPLDSFCISFGPTSSNSTQNHVVNSLLFWSFGRLRHLSPYFVIEQINDFPLLIRAAALG